MPWTVSNRGTQRVVTKKNRGRVIHRALSQHGGLAGFVGLIRKLLAGGMVGAAQAKLAWAANGRLRPTVLPSVEYEAATREIAPELRRQWGRRPTLRGTPLRVTARFYLPARSTPDLLSLLEALADLLEHAGVIANDYWIQSWGASGMERDRGVPRCEVWIRHAGAGE